jgi:hypothetical protein
MHRETPTARYLHVLLDSGPFLATGAILIAFTDGFVGPGRAPQVAFATQTSALLVIGRLGRNGVTDRPVPDHRPGQPQRHVRERHPSQPGRAERERHHRHRPCHLPADRRRADRVRGRRLRQFTSRNGWRGCLPLPTCSPRSWSAARRSLSICGPSGPVGRFPIPWAATAYPPASASPYRAPAARAMRAIRSCRGSIARRLRGRRDAADLREDREPLLPRPAKLGRKPQQRPQPP